jgi:hypothetical protein
MKLLQILYKIFKKPKDVLGFMSVIVLHSNNRDVSATRVAIFRGMTTTIHIQL